MIVKRISRVSPRASVGARAAICGATLLALWGAPQSVAQSTSLTYVPGSSVKLYQINGDCDWVQWDATITNPTPTCNPTTSKTATNADVLGDDVASSFEHNGELIMTFGDTIGADSTYSPTWTSVQNTFKWGAHDPIARSTTQNAQDGLLLNFFLNGNHGLEIEPPPQPNGTAVDMGIDNIPIGGISLDGQIYIVVKTGAMTTNNNTDQSLDYSVLTTFNEASQTFTTGRTISQLPGGHFIHITLHEASPGLLGTPAPVAPEPDIVMFGQGEIRASNIYLAVIPESEFASGVDSSGNSATRYFAGMSQGQPTWSTSESAAVPVITDINPASPTIDNSSAFYSQQLGLWLMTFDGGRNSPSTNGVYFTYAPQPWGPWSTPQLVFNACRDKAFGNFMFYYYATAAQNNCPSAMPPGVTSAPNSSGPSGPTIGDQITNNPPSATLGFPYAPSMIQRFTTITGNTLKIYYTLSTWNPYTVVLMESDFTLAGCPYSLNTSGLAFSGAGGTGTVTITTNPGCPWSVSGLPSWITLTGPSSGTGSGSVSFQVLSSGADQSGSFTLADQTFTIDQEASSIPGLSFVGSMPHLAAEDGWNTTFTLVNKSSASVDARASLFGDSGTSLALPLTFPQQPSPGPLLGASIDQTLAANAALIMEASGPASAPLSEGSGQLFATGGSSAGNAVDGFAIFHYDPTAQEAVVPLETRNAPSYLLAFDNTNTVLTGVALGNVSGQAASIPVVVRDDTGKTIGTTTISLNAYGHTSFVLSTSPQFPQFSNTANIRGTVEFDTPAGGQISVLGIRYTPPGTLTTIPALANVGTIGGLMAHLASGAGWETTFVVVNTGASAAQAQLNFFDNNGNPLPLPLTFPQSNTALVELTAVVTQTVGANASLWIQSTGPLTSSLLTGFAQLTTTGNISGFVIFRYNPNGQEAVVPLESRNAPAYLLAFDNTNGTATGVAISEVSTVNVSGMLRGGPGAQINVVGIPLAATIAPVILRDDTGAQIGAGTIPLPLNGHSSFLLATQFPVTAGIRGTVEFDAPLDAQISVLGIRSPPTLTFTTLPALAK